MLLLKNEKVFNISDSRLKLKGFVVKKEDEVDEDIRKLYEVYVDGSFYTKALVVYLEHSQYLLFEQCYMELPIVEMFGKFGTVVFRDAGIQSVDGKTSQTILTDYTEKGKEGISYFSDIIIESDKRGDFKDNYIRLGVKV